MPPATLLVDELTTDGINATLQTGGGEGANDVLVNEWMFRQWVENPYDRFRLYSESMATGLVRVLTGNAAAYVKVRPFFVYSANKPGGGVQSTSVNPLLNCALQTHPPPPPFCHTTPTPHVPRPRLAARASVFGLMARPSARNRRQTLTSPTQ